MKKMETQANKSKTHSTAIFKILFTAP